MPLQQNYVQSLNALPNVTVKYFIVPRTLSARLPRPRSWLGRPHQTLCTSWHIAAYKVNIPYTRVNHAKWMVTDKQLFIDTSNWYAQSQAQRAPNALPLTGC